MEILIKIKDILLAFWAWILHFFKQNEKSSIKEKQKLTNRKNKTVYKASINRDDHKASNTIIVYPGVLPKEIEKLNKKVDIIKNKLISNNDQHLEEEIKTLDQISKIINREKILINEIDELNEIIDLTLNDQELHLNTNDKINILKDNIVNLIDENLKDYEKRIIEKAYYEYDKVNYVIVTTLLIDELNNEINKIQNDFQKNNHNKNYYIDKIRSIEKRLERITKITNKKEVYEELEHLKNDLYTKRKDKYDLLYNKEIFDDLQNRCNQIIKNIEIKEKQQNDKQDIIKKEEQLRKEQLGQEQKKKELEAKKEELLEEKQREENIFKRFIDLELARRILITRQITKLKGKKRDIVEETLENYNEFLTGEYNDFNFSRNKLKVEVVKLYNDTLRNISELEKEPYIPIEHINVKLSNIVSETLENQQKLNILICQQKKVNLEENKISVSVNQKLNGILEKEKIREESKDKPKVYKREYKPINQKETKQNNI